MTEENISQEFRLKERDKKINYCIEETKQNELIRNYSKYAWVVPLKDRKGITIINAFQKILNKSDRKPNKIWVDKGIKF